MIAKRTPKLTIKNTEYSVKDEFQENKILILIHAGHSIFHWDILYFISQPYLGD